MERANQLTRAQVQEILRLYPDTPAREIAEKFGKSISNIYKTAYRYRVVKSEDFRNSEKSGRIRKGQHLSPATQLKKGHVPASKGKKQTDYIRPEKLENVRKHLWQKGHKSHTTKYDGAITLRQINYKNSAGCSQFYFIRIAENKWKFLHRHLWEQHNGKIEKGYNVVFKDGNSLNCTIENLECISNAELAERNRLTRYPIELQKSIKLKNKLIKKLKDYGKE